MVLLEDGLVVEEKYRLDPAIGNAVNSAVEGHARHDSRKISVLPGGVCIQIIGHVIDIIRVDVGLEDAAAPTEKDIRRIMRTHRDLQFLLVGIVLDEIDD